ncbi:MAG: hypothetical protein LAP61_29415 [Acidobacteriia bacterium]|nr:hypothetical protein [Terriglobia bacterium]
MFEITPNDIARLDDEKLRTVVSRLCEAELRQRGLSSSCVTWGGNQDAADGGIDVRIALPLGSMIDGFIPRPATGFQVKHQDMPRAEILDEMRPNGVMRPAIQSLADQAGAYIIVSSQGSTADPVLTNRRVAMQEAMQGVLNADRLLLDFYDRTRIATWVRSHEALIPWVREQVGRTIVGWHSFGSWAYAPDPITAEYLFDDKLRIHPSKRNTDTGVSALEGIRQMRNQLREPRSVVRLVGLSGVGKTRLVQALFDDRVGVQSLNPSHAIYTNMADSPDPQPTGLASELAAAGTSAILVVDNCPPELHQRLSEVCRQEPSKLSLITVEYDIREDEPEGTEVFTLETSSPELIGKLLRQRFPTISQTDARTIAEFSGGNARIAIALAATIERNGTVAGLTDDQLFQRLFVQRHTPDESLYLVAQACALVYSFEGEDVSADHMAELIRLGTMIGKTAQDVYRHVAELQRRDLVQQRGVWRAVLPHAIANRVAAIALQNIPYAAIDEQLLRTASGRLMKSFSRRLGYLHASKEAQAIVKKWLGKQGLLEDVSNFNDLGKAMFENVAPVVPEDVLSALERTCALQPAAGEHYVELLRSIAYEPAHFRRCMTLMATILAAGQNNEQSRRREIFTSMFQLCLSGTQATIEQRLGVLGSLLRSSDAKLRALGLAGLKTALEAWHFNSVSNFDFGAWPRDFGYWPRNTQDVRHWFAAILKLVETLARDDGLVASDARAALAEKFRGIWHRGGVCDELATLCRQITRLRFWPEGWLAVRQTLDLDGKGMEAERLAQLVGIEQDLRPADLSEKVRSVVLSPRIHGIDFEDFDEHPGEDSSAKMARTEALARTLGKAVATNEEILASLVPALVSSDGRLWSFGAGLLDGTTDAAALWDCLVAALNATEESLRNLQVLRGFLNALHAKDPALATALLDSSVDHETLTYVYPLLQVAIQLDHQGIARLKRSLALGKTPAHMFTYLAYGRATDPIPPSDLKELVLTIAGIQGGDAVAIQILQMRLHSDKDRNEPIAQELVDAGRELLRQLSFATKNDQGDYRIGDIAKHCLTGDQGAAVATGICATLKAAVTTYETHAFYHDDLLDGLFSAQPCAALDGLCGGDREELDRGIQVLRGVGSRKQPLAVVPEATLLQWCDQDPWSRYPALACVITVIEQVKDKPPRWTSLALRFLERAPDPAAVLQQFVCQFRPSSGWRGSLAAILETNAALLDQLDEYPGLREAVVLEKERLQEWIKSERVRETASNRARDERFE